MSHISPINPLTGTLNLPLVVAALTSVGLHSLIWFYQPLVPMADKATAASDRRSVRVVQLTPEEILRLPEYAQQRTQTTLPNLPPGQVPTNLLPSLPQAKSEITLPPPPSFPIYNPNPSLPSPTPEPKTPTSRRRTRTTVPKSPQDSAKNNRRNNQSSRNQKPETTEKITLDQLNLGSRSQTQDRTSSQSPQTNQSLQNSQTSGGQFGDTYQRFLAQQNLDSTSQSTQSRQDETQSQNNQSQNNQQTIGELLDRNQLQRDLVAGANNDRPQNRNEENTTRAQNRNNLRNNRNPADEEARIKVVYGYNVANTSIPQGLANYEQWRTEKIKKYGGRLNSKRPPITDSIRSPFDIKVPDVTPAGIAVLVDPEGKIVETELIRSTGYKQLNDLAIAQMKKRSFSATGKYEAYHYFIEVDQKDLPNASDAASR
ncbi:hypothetical protein IQ264_29735 [Phormidium sp. LEGE 05292]|uniref:energy transducer TonB n=1 Tax=[Phormidium] sp. LEGE 05292 TaxID=767427 RepID=UPI00187E0BE3|nr:hypothetical protein [Phormidium sp. LEGE 05292]MBE9229592.1 hypothetical protein [Phormidium sp. LEGE 05292]